MWLVHVLLLLFVSTSCLAGDSEELYRLNENGMCQQVKDPSKTKKPVAAQSLDQVKKEFYAVNSFCADLPTCLTSDRVYKLMVNRYIPDGAASGNFLTTRFQQKSKKACLEHDKTSQTFLEVIDNLRDQGKTYPVETKMAYDMVQQTKDSVDKELDQFPKALRALEPCLKLNVELEKTSRSSEKKLALYRSLDKMQADTPKGCEVIWQPKSEINQLGSQLTKMRLSLFALNIINSSGAKDYNSLIAYAEDLENDRPLPPKGQALRDGALSLKKGNFLKFESPVWNGTPDKLEPLSPGERKQLKAHLLEMQKTFKGLSPQQALELDYYDNVDDNPVLKSFSSAEPSAAEILSVYQKTLANIETTYKPKRPDVDYLSVSPSFLHETIMSLPPDLRGDYCVLAEAMLRARKETVDAPLDMAMALLMLETGGAARVGWEAALMASNSWKELIAKGAVKTGSALLFGAKYTGPAVGVLWMNRLGDIEKQQLSDCATAYKDSDGLCRIDKLEGTNSDARKMQMAMGLMFLKHPIVLSTAALTSSTTVEKKK